LRVEVSSASFDTMYIAKSFWILNYIIIYHMICLINKKDMYAKSCNIDTDHY